VVRPEQPLASPTSNRHGIQAKQNSNPETAAWTVIDGKIDTVLRALRSTKPDTAAEQKALTDLLTSLT
jgi:hypothetical protein